MKHTKKTVGIVVGRFQVAGLHEGHRYLLRYALRENLQVSVVFGKGEALLSDRNPLPSSVRALTIRESFPNVSVLEHADHPSDKEWSKRLDALLVKAFPGATITLYASRDSFSNHYSGKLPIVTVPMVPGISGTSERATASDPSDWNTHFRKGMIEAQRLRPPLSYQTVDIAVIRYPESEILLGQKRTDGDSWRLVGGFVDPGDTSLEAAALRELGEEAGNISTHALTYVGSYRVDDWRYRKERDKIMTALFVTYHLSGVAHPGDDLVRVAWHPLPIDMKNIVETHRPLVKLVIETLKKKGA